MQSIILPKIPRLHGEEAIEVLQNFIKELEEKGGTKLTDKQIMTLKKLAKGIITTIEAEKSREPKIKEMGFSSRLRRAIVGQVRKSDRPIENVDVGRCS